MNIRETLSHPLDAQLILRKKNTIKRHLAERDGLRPLKVAMLGGSTTSELLALLECFLLDYGFAAEFYESEYNQFYQDALFNLDALRAFAPDIVVVHTSSRNVLHWPSPGVTEDDVNALLGSELQRFDAVWDALSALECPVIQNNFDHLGERVLGNMDGYALAGASHYLARLNLAFAEAARRRTALYINDIHYLSAQVGISRWHDEKLWCVAKYAMSLEACVEVAWSMAKIINAVKGGSKKCLVLDLDNTCWGGVIGDDGLHGIAIGTETAHAEAYTRFQRYVKKLHGRGVMLAVCSKNEEGNAKQGFGHPDSVLSLADFSAFKANWDPKSHNIGEIAREMNIGEDALVFIDDNPAERDIVSAQLPSVAVPDVGDDVTDFIDHIDKNGFFEAVALSKDDLERNRHYQQNAQRQSEQATFAHYDDYLASLAMQAEILPFSPLYIERIAQLTNKTNQFNLTTKRYSVAELSERANHPQYITLYGRLRDKFGDNGLIAVNLIEIKNDSEAHIDLWLMSCRVLKRNMEQAMLDEIVQACIARDIHTLYGYYSATAKNAMVKELYGSLGFTRVSGDDNNSTWVLSIPSPYTKQNTLIEVNNGYHNN